MMFVQKVDHTENIKLASLQHNTKLNKMSTKAHVYMLTNERGNVLYIGSTDDLKKRIYFHKNRLIPGFTKKYNAHKLVYFEEHPNLESALTREKYLKGKSRTKKNKLIISMNPNLNDLSTLL